MKSSNAVVAFPDAAARRRRDHELAFLPAALEIVETPPSPIGRAIGATLIAVFLLALAWACLGTVDIVATAPGKIIPSGRIATQLDVARLRAALADGPDPLADFHPPAGANPDLIATQRQHLMAQTAEQIRVRPGRRMELGERVGAVREGGA